MELSMNIATYSDWSFYGLGIGLIDEYFHGLIANELDFAFCNGFELLKSFDDGVNIMIL